MPPVGPCRQGRLACGPDRPNPESRVQRRAGLTTERVDDRGDLDLQRVIPEALGVTDVVLAMHRERQPRRRGGDEQVASIAGQHRATREQCDNRAALQTASRVAALAFAIALASAGCSGVGGAEHCEPPRTAIAFDNHPGGDLDIVDIHLINADGMRRRMLVKDGGGAAWSPNGCRIAFIRDDVYVVDANGTGVRRLTTSRAGQNVPSPTAIAWSPDGHRIVVTLAGEENFSESSYIDVFDSDGGGRRRLVPFQAGEPSWSPDSSRIAFDRWFSIDGTDLYVVDADGGNLRRLTGRSNRSFGSDSPAWSPDGRRIAFVRAGSLDAPSEIYVIGVDGTGLRRVTTSPRDPGNQGDFPVVWSPDGQRIAFVRNSNVRGPDIYVVRIDGGGLRRLTRSGDASEPAWSPDGRQIVFTRTVAAGWYDQADLYVSDADGSGLRRLTRTPDLEAGPVWSPQ